MNHYLSFGTAAVLLFSPFVSAQAAFGQSVPNQGASILQPEPQLGPRLAQLTTAPLTDEELDVIYLQSRNNPEWHLSQDNFDVEFSPGQYHGNRGPASEETGIQLKLISQ
ncbi:MAG: hypothetical protein AAGB01_09500 [Cyanobacteria bacterium P01_F01_bin.42]